MRTTAEIVAEIKQRQAARQAARVAAPPESVAMQGVAAVATGSVPSGKPSRAEVDRMARELAKLTPDELGAFIANLHAVARIERRKAKAQNVEMRDAHNENQKTL